MLRISFPRGIWCVGDGGAEIWKSLINRFMISSPEGFEV